MNKKYSNALVNETSPYLLQHAHNPVNWYPWGEEALNLAKEKDIPILVSIGYSACHWCHVMERESFENELVATYMNQHFINIKVDREERPDLDHIYMDALQAISGNGGWPLNVFLTPEGKPFYGGTYFPPQKAFNRASWSDVLKSMTDAWINKRDEVELQAKSLIEHIKKSNSFAVSNNMVPNTEKVSFFNAEDCRLMAANILKSADTTDGGLGKAPKFLQTFSLQYLLQYSHLLGDEASKNHALFSLQKKLNGGIYDQLAGGISRYSTDNQWLVPHFEKMLYDNALLTIVLCDAYQISRQKEFAMGICNTLQFCLNEMKHPEGGFYTALDADSEAVEGKFYVWQKKEIEELLGINAAIFCDYYNVSENGNWEKINILHITSSQIDIAAKHQITLDTFKSIITESKQILLSARNQRIRPGTDDKILLGCNALLISAFCKSYAALQEESYKTAAIELFEFIEDKFKDALGDTGMLHTYKNLKAKYPAFLDDYAYLIQAGIHLQEITSNQQYLYRAKELASYVLKNFSDNDSPFLFFTRIDQKDIVVRKIEIYDGATPSANAVMANNLLYLGIVFDEPSWHLRGVEMLKNIFNSVRDYPNSFAVWAGSYLLQTAGINEIAVTGKKITASLNEVLEQYIPNKILQSSTWENEMPLLQQKSYETDTTLYLCRNYHCERPTKVVLELLDSINKQRIK
jgi:uncharacterized protein YyaL (SSP411 family)